jgi:hypothetical protein
MSRERKSKTATPSFGKRDAGSVKQAKREPASMGRLAQFFGRWWGRKVEPQKKHAKKASGVKR